MFARVNRIDLYYESHGFGDPILLLPGLGSDAATWQPFVPQFSSRYRIILVENRGSGRSSKPPGEYSTALMAEDAVALLQHLGIERAHVIGKSMGGMIAQVLAAGYPEKVRSLVLACTLMKHDAYGAELLSLSRRIAETAGLFAMYRLSFLLSYSREYCMTNRTRLQEVEAMLKQVNQEEMLRGYIGQSIACEKHDSRTLAPRIQAPTLILVGKDDIITPPSASKQLAETIPRSELVILPHGGHGFWREYPGEVNSFVQDFLSKH